MSENDKKNEFDKLKTPEERREWIEALHEKTHGKSHFSEQAQAIHHALAGQSDKDSVLEVMIEILGVEPVEYDGVYRAGDWEVSFDKHNNLQFISASRGVPGMIQAELKPSGDS